MRRYVGVAAALLVMMPVCCALAQDDTILPHVRSAVSEPINWTQNLPLIGMQILITTWIFVLGSCFGSFLNVVIYRLPAGMSLGKPKSRCPRCETQLAVKDNIPVLGWLLLKGKCRYCGLPISARYPIIEAVCGGIFLILLFAELLSGAANLPLRQPDHFHIQPGLWLVWFTKWDLSGLYLYHCCLLMVVLAITMIAYDGHAPHKKLTAFGIIVALVAGMLFQELRPVPALPWSPSMLSRQWGFWWNDPLDLNSRYWTGITLTGLLDGLLGMLGGYLAGRLVRWQMTPPGAHTTAPPVAAFSSALLVTGCFLGWQACGMLLLLILPPLALIKFRNTQAADSRLLRFSAPAFAALLVAFVVLWQQLDSAIWMISFQGWSFTELRWMGDWLGTMAVLTVLATIVRYAVTDPPNAPRVTTDRVAETDHNQRPAP